MPGGEECVQLARADLLHAVPRLAQAAGRQAQHDRSDQVRITRFKEIVSRDNILLKIVKSNKNLTIKSHQKVLINFIEIL
jgi:hypothetical protein